MGRPKALLPYQSDIFLTRLIRAFGSVSAQTIVVTGTHDAEIRAAIVAKGELMCGAGCQPAAGALAPDSKNAAIPPPGGIVTIVTNPDPSRGQLSSLQLGLRAVDPKHGAVFFHPVDAPLVAAETVMLLRDALATAPPSTLLVIPRYGGKHGHPVLIRCELMKSFLALDPATASARDVIYAHRDRTLYVDVDDVGVTLDIDTPDEYQRLIDGGAR